MTRYLFVLSAFLLGLVTTSFFPTEEQIQDRFALGQRYYAANDHENCVKIFKEIEEMPNYPLLNVDRIEVRIEELVLPIRVAATYQLGNSYRNVGRTLLERSENALAEGDTSLAGRRRKEARRAFDEAKGHYGRIVDDPKAPYEVRVMAQYQIVRADFQMGNYPEAVADVEELLRRFPGSDYEEAAIYDMGWAYHYMGKYEECIATFRKLLEISHDDIKLDRATFQIAESHLALGRYDDAVRWFRRLVDKYDFSKMTEEELQAMKVQRLRGLVKETTRELVAKAQIRIGDTYAEQGKVAEAIEAYSLVSERYPQEIVLVEESYERMADLVFRERGVDEGVRVLREAMEVVDDPAFRARAQLRIAKSLYDAGRYPEAVEEYQVYMKAYGEVAREVGFALDDATFMVAEGYRHMAEEDTSAAEGLYLEATSHYRGLLSSYPSSPRAPDALYGLGLSYYGLGLPDSASSCFSRVLELYPSAPVAPYALMWHARLKFEGGDYEGAVDSYLRLLREYPGHELSDRAYKNLGLCYRKLGMTEEAIRAFRNVPPSSPFWPKVQAEAGDMLVAEGRFEDAERLLDLDGAIGTSERMGDVETSAEIFYIKARIARAKGKYAEEVGYLSEILKRTSNPLLTSFARLFRGLAEYELGKEEDSRGDSASAVLHYENCISDLDSFLSGEVPPKARLVAYRTRGTALIRLGRAEQTVRNYSQLIESAISPEERSDYQLLLMELYYDQEKLEDAERVAEEIIAGDFVDDDRAGFFKRERAYSVLSSVYMEQGRYRDALRTASEGLKRFPHGTESGAMGFVVGRALYLLERYEEAAEAFRSYIREHPDHPELPSGYYHLGYCYEILGRYEEAAEVFRTLAEKFPDHEFVPDALYRMGENLYNATKFRRALEIYLEVARRFPDTEFAPRALYSAAWTYLDLGRPEEAVGTMEELVALYPESDYARYAQFSVGDYYYSTKDYRKAQEAYRKVIRMFPGTEEARKAEALLLDLEEDIASEEYEMAFAEFQKGNYDYAARAFREIAEAHPETYTALAALANLGVALEHLGDAEGARQAYMKVISLGGDDPDNREVVEFAKARLQNL